MITETFSEANQSASARSVYLALCQLASDEQSDTFTSRKALIAHKSGVSIKTVERILSDFEKLRVIKVHRNCAAGAFKAPSTYTLLTIRHGDATMRHHGKHAFKSDKDKESGKISEKISKKSDTRARTRTRTRRATQSANGESIESVLSLEEAEKHPFWPEFKAYCKGTPSVKGFFNTWLPKQSKARLEKAFAQDQDKIKALRHDLISEYCNGAIADGERFRAFRQHAPPEVQEEFDSLGARLHK